MASIIIPSATFSLLIIIMMLHCINAQPSLDYHPSSILRPLKGFYHGYSNLWGGNHMWVSNDQSSLTIWLDRSSGSGFKSTRPFRNGYFGAYIKLQAGYTAGVITAFYLSNDQAHPGRHDEVDIEFMGTIPGKPYRLQTNIYVKGSGDRRIVGREMKFHLWFDPTADFHHYAILWNPEEIIFFVDDIPIRQYKKKSADTYPLRPMWMYGSIWDASPWATDNGKYRVNYRYEPFVAKFNRFTIRGCSAFAPQYCRPVASSPSGTGLSSSQYAAMQWAQQNWMVYYYCKDPKRDHSLTPECWS